MISRAIKAFTSTFPFELRATFVHKLGLLKAYEYQKKHNLKLHLACGENYKKGWVNIDLNSSVADLLLDLRKELPFKDKTCSEVYSEHFLEHLEYPYDAEQFLKQIKRVLKPGGKLTIVVPDTAWPMKSYFEGYSAPYFAITKAKKWHPVEYAFRMEHLNYHFRQGGEHHYAYDEELLKGLLKRMDFVSIKKRTFKANIDSEFHHPGSLYMEAVNK